ncbi:acyl-CoA/acyl-ACP dehydrogenase [Myxococcota bacterium]|nr:acyl-CoA/acyl-ACP dehydrogenase [Myxococcota bacterium]MCZ7620636.1 acyl-CoA/acyl-ACP dehydrogenase [Myxococcota bacterium]
MRLDVPTDFGFTEEHALLRGEARRFLGERLPMATLRRMLDAGHRFDHGLWKEIAELGWLGLVLPERFGGAGLGWLHLEILMEEMGRRLVPGPFLGSLLAGIVLEQAGSESQQAQWLPAIAAGERVATLALVESGGGFDADTLTASADPVDGGYVLRGRKTHVVGGADASLVVAAFREPSGHTALFAIELPTSGVSIEDEVSIDPTRPTARIGFDGVRVGPEARLDGPGGAALAATQVRGCAALAAEQVGGAESVLLLVRDYAIDRKQFDRPIGFFQAVKHPIVDMMCGVELARSLACGAAAALDAGSPAAEVHARMAKALAGDVYASAVRKGVQIHGGYGFTWDCDVHFYFRRALWSRPMLGDAIHHRRHLATLLLDAD